MPANRLSRLLAPLERLPAPVRARVRSLLIGKIVPFVGTARLSIDELTSTRAVVSIKNRRKVRNHIGGVHAAAVTLIAETASGFVVGVNLPDDRVPVIKTMRIDFRKRSKGSMRAVAELTDEQVKTITGSERGELPVHVTVIDEEDKEPVTCEMVWAWTPKRR